MSDNAPGSKGSSPYGQNQPQYGQNQPAYGEQTTSPYGEQSASPYGQQSPSPYGTPDAGMPTYPGQQNYQGQPVENPGRVLGIVGFILAIFIAPVGLIISIVAFVKSRKAGMGNGLALAGIIIGAILTIVGTILAIIFGIAVAEFAQQLIEACDGLPSGTAVTVQGAPTECP